ncbi:LOW QUALITY PROTEIN: E3 ubiquitin-protein ligase TRIM31 [Trichechus inunguis]
MASPQFVNKLQEEVVCPICIDILQDPVTIDYGQNFCFRCITQNGDASVLKCPLCKKSVRRDTVRPSCLLMNLVEKIQAMSPFEAQPEREELRCQKHQEKIHYFCEHDGKFLCTVRRESKDRKLHKANLIEEAAQNYQDIKVLLYRSQRFQFLHPTALPLDLENKLSEAKSRNDSITETLKNSEVRKKLLPSLSPTSRGFSPYHPSPASSENLGSIRSAWREELKVAPTSVTLDAASAHPDLVLSQDLQTVTLPFVPQGDSEESADPQRFYPFRCAGLPGVSGGCQAWEAELGGVGAGPAAGRGLGLECQALLDGNTREELPVCPSRVGVRVDHERGEVVFYDAITSKHISIFHACFPGRVFAFFRLLFTGTQIALSP